jgi:dTDP-4-dehydrorhamnose reductase
VEGIKKMKILLLGHKGMLGSDLYSYLGNFHAVIGMDKEEIDITSYAECEKVCDKVMPEIVINAAAYTDVDGCETNMEKAFAVNSWAVMNLAKLCRENHIKLVHFSTDYVFDGNINIPYKEDDRERAINVYGNSKSVGEKLLRDNVYKYLIIRTSWLYGKNGKNFVKSILEKAKAGEEISVVCDQIGVPTYTKDLAFAVNVLLSLKKTGTYHVTNSESCTWHNFARVILYDAGFADKEITAIASSQLDREAQRPLYSVLNNEKFELATGYRMRNWRKALQNYLEEEGYGRRKINL